MNELTVHTFRTTPTGRFNVAERCALALTLIQMTGVADLSTSLYLILPAVIDRHYQGQRFTAIMTSYLNGSPLRSNQNYARHKASKGFQEYFKTFVTNSVPQTNQTTGL
jgi:hypothetical protein